MNTEEAALWSAVKANPADALPRGVLADWYEERGKADLAFALRWSMRRGVYPRVSPKGRTANWEADLLRRYHPTKPVPAHVIPRVVFGQLRPIGGSASRYGDSKSRWTARTVPEAFEALGKALAVIRAVLE